MRFRFRSIPPALAVVALWGALAALGLGAQSWGTSATDAPPPPVSPPINAGKVVVMPVATLEEGPAGVRSDVYKYDGWTVIASNTGLVMQRDPSADTPRTGSTTTEPQTPLSR
jgi:hypothetical protein